MFLRNVWRYQRCSEVVVFDKFLKDYIFPTRNVHFTVHQLSYCNLNVPGQNQICFLSEITRPRWLKHIFTVPLSSSQRSSTVYIYLSTYSSGFFSWNKITLMLIIHFKSICKTIVFWIRMSFFQQKKQFNFIWASI